jgi:hypothetical protein
MPSVAGVCDVRNLERNRKASGLGKNFHHGGTGVTEEPFFSQWLCVSVVRWIVSACGRAVACGLCPPATAFGRVELFSLSTLDAALEGPLFHVDVGRGVPTLSQNARKDGPPAPPAVPPCTSLLYIDMCLYLLMSILAQLSARHSGLSRGRCGVGADAKPSHRFGICLGACVSNVRGTKD